MFHPISGLSQREQQDSNTRPFVADGTPYLKVPGLKRVTRVRMDGLEIPLSIVLEHPVDASDRPRLIAIPQPLVNVQPDEDGTPILLRSVLSNDGVWQKDARVYVTGEWAEEEAEPTVRALPHRSVQQDRQR